MSKSIEEKLRILSDAAKYDVSCSSSGSSRKNTNNGLGNAAINGICHSWSADGRCISLLKILMTNYCIYDCKYCINRKDNDIERAILTPDEIVKLTINFYRRNYIEGLFLSSGIIKNADYTMELMIAVAKKLRLEEKFNGYIHMKVIPGASRQLINEIGLYVDRVSVNIEFAENRALKLLAPDKKPTDISTSMGLIRKNMLENAEDKRLFKSTPSFIPAGQTTQMIIGASGESDYAILSRSENLYKNFDLKRVYYSGYVPVNKSGILVSADQSVPMIREHRLYQADWLLRFYDFRADEILNEKDPFVDPFLDPKTNWAIKNSHLFPIEINKASYKELLRVPGIGVTSAKRIVMTRKYSTIRYEHLKKLGIVIKRAKYFITVNGEFLGFKKENPELIRNALMEKEKMVAEQLKLFNV
ncbi:putative DNA modification/repair radical SAM protein [Fusobacterium nucleatum subsp. nucleatum ATCC 25586]|uniref:Biotin synthase related domain containing protein n=1 Tax=Fusobacterium nucleatum subsp. nucleatum (strain ATCC 25586 / DSM 15643 / BCRC 10681 / CIP 101130 / JCM 8532 / KCTC 2640 / LMG 13131 / VPI 4355) TaxID=190304 RepID=Q8REY0_FUSNN|nr:putative DNA modification/repair radical SAM protein [Fusobacterium nucleatum]AAL95150.1 biotin synthase related domain containing protein [Fusobacterium nucleatum subsp. nucleatum ATCC 25586]ALF25414.1 radical SAM protein [Fusobacterium nucleatum subsp. nucleatum]AVQ15316.1 putative DNA modification/repair radical SAM protein [Fusobacterium nucleatum subsp. nucleatum ATCC 25586]WMS30236.1 putative DNA modification/repair radical SAM protein [Fusobacterium nucleatum]